MRAFPLLAVAALALAAGACAAPPAQTSAGEAVSGPKSGDGEERAAARAGQSWWQRITRPRREPGEKPWVYGAVRPGKGLLSDEEGGYVLYRQGEADSSDDPTKPTKVRR